MRTRLYRQTQTPGASCSTARFSSSLLLAWSPLSGVGRRKQAPPMLGVADEHKPTRGYRHVTSQPRPIKGPQTFGSWRFNLGSLRPRQGSSGTAADGLQSTPGRRLAKAQIEAVDEMRRSSSLSLSLSVFSLDWRCCFRLSRLLSDFSPVSAARRRQTASLPSIQNTARVARRNGDAGFSTSGRPSQNRWVSCRLPGNSPQRHGAVARPHLTASGESWRWRAPPNSRAHCDVDVGPGVETAKSRITPTWTTQRVQGTNIIACRCPDIPVPSDITRSRLSEAHLDSPGPPSGAVDPLMSIRALFPGCLGWRMLFWTSAVRRRHGTQGNKFRPIAPYATDWWSEMMLCAGNTPSLPGCVPPSCLIVVVEKAKCILAGPEGG
jgi:hypothetical protein